MVAKKLDPGLVAERILEFFATRKRALPWRKNRDPYAIWISEIMLQQTRVETVIPYFERWMDRFPTVASLATAEEGAVLAAWSGLGYYSRARNIHRCARITNDNGGAFPRSASELQELPGIGRYTAGAIASQAYGLPEPVVDANVARVLARLYALGLDVKSSAGQRALWALAGELVPDSNPGDFNQGLMELGQAVCTARKPTCEECPLRAECRARELGLTAELPVLPARKKRSDKPLLHQAAFLARKGRRILVGKRPASGLYAGLWELPAANDRAALLAAFEHLVLDSEPAHRREQELSHRRLCIDVYLGELARKPHTALVYTELRWHRLASISELGVSSATSAILAALA